MTQHLVHPRPTLGCTVQVAAGREALDRIGRFGSFIDAHSTAYCTTSAWLGAAARTLGGEPVVLSVHDAGEVVGVVALSRRRRRGAWRIELLGGQFNDYGQIYQASDRAAAALAEALVGWITSQHRWWSVTLAQLPEHDVAVREVLARLPGSRLEPGAPMPQIRGVGTEYVVSRNRRRKVRNSTNRIINDGRTAEHRAIRSRDELDHWLPIVIDVRRARDHAVGRRSHLDDPPSRAFFEEFVRDLCDADRLTLHLLLVDGEVAGYCMAAHDPGAHRLFDGRVAEGMEHYRGGMACDIAAVLAASEDPTVSTFDWLRGRREGKFGNHEVQPVDLLATSHALVDRLDRWDQGARRWAKGLLPDAALRRIAER